MIPIKNPTPDEIKILIALSEHKAAKWLKDSANGEIYCWPAEIYQHAEVAKALKISDYSKGIAVDD